MERQNINPKTFRQQHKILNWKITCLMNVLQKIRCIHTPVAFYRGGIGAQFWKEDWRCTRLHNCREAVVTENARLELAHVEYKIEESENKHFVKLQLL